MSAKPVRFLLPTGDAAWLRPVVPDDRDRLREALGRTSPRPRAARFGRDRSAFTEGELDDFTRVDQRDHVAWCAVAGWIPGEPGIGSARFVRDPEHPDAAEMAVTVLDEYHGMGVGTALLAVLYAIAPERGIRWLVGQVLADNHAVLRRLRRLGADVTWKDVIYEVRLPVEPGGPPAAEPETAERFRELLRSLEAGESPARIRGSSSSLGGGPLGCSPSTEVPAPAISRCSSERRAPGWRTVGAVGGRKRPTSAASLQEPAPSGDGFAIVRAILGDLPVVGEHPTRSPLHAPRTSSQPIRLSLNGVAAT